MVNEQIVRKEAMKYIDENPSFDPDRKRRLKLFVDEILKQ